WWQGADGLPELSEAVSFACAIVSRARSEAKPVKLRAGVARVVVVVEVRGRCYDKIHKTCPAQVLICAENALGDQFELRCPGKGANDALQPLNVFEHQPQFGRQNVADRRIADLWLAHCRPPCQAWLIGIV